MSSISGPSFDTSASRVEAYYGTIKPLAPGSTISAPPGGILATDTDTVLNSARMAGGYRFENVWAAASVKDATAIAAIRAYKASQAVPHNVIHVHRVQLVPFHLGPVAIVEELERRRTQGGAVEALVSEYWAPTSTWHLKEILGASLAVGEEVTPASEAETYLQRWVRYNEDRERARSL